MLKKVLKIVTITIGVFMIIFIVGCGYIYYHYYCASFTIEGKAYKPEPYGEPIEGIEVSVYGKAYNDPFYTGDFSRKQTTDKDGKYSIRLDSRVERFTISFNTKTNNNVVMRYKVNELNRDDYIIDLYFDKENNVHIIENKSDHIDLSVTY